MIISEIINKIKGVTPNSRNVKQGYCFVAIKGDSFDGNNFINDAIEKGATIIISEAIHKPISGVHFIKVDDARLALSYVASKIYSKQPKYTVAVTGTNGKTSVSYFYKQIMELLSYKSAYIGTLGVSAYDNNSKCLTTPDTVDIHKILNQLAQDEYEAVCMEASSHGLLQNRLANVRFSAAAFTNLSQDHLDYHSNMDNYFEAKMLLFSQMQNNSIAVINADIAEYNKIKNICIDKKHKIISYGKADEATLKIENIKAIDGIQYVSFYYQNEIYNLKLNIMGEFQVYNVLCAIGLVLGSGIYMKEIISIIDKVVAAPGRMEVVNNKDKVIVIDFSHTPDALEKALLSLKSVVTNNLIVVFGCGGMRDKEKRPIMGSIACKLADKVIVTDDNPRNESPDIIRQEIIKGCNKEAVNIGGRLQAIKYALDIMEKGDMLLIAGKGHETRQILADKEIEFNDLKIVKELLGL
jgi:UDP-N-acetylmuramoyl-L-alanyl-D-glutamate--2,6-diaminopimelate ligase